MNPEWLSIDNDKLLWHTEDGQVLFCIQILFTASCQASYVPSTTSSGAFPHSRTKMRADRGGMGAICALSISFHPCRKHAGHTNHKLSCSFSHGLCKRYNMGSSGGVHCSPRSPAMLPTGSHLDVHCALSTRGEAAADEPPPMLLQLCGLSIRNLPEQLRSVHPGGLLPPLPSHWALLPSAPRFHLTGSQSLPSCSFLLPVVSDSELMELL